VLEFDIIKTVFFGRAAGGCIALAEIDCAGNELRQNWTAWKLKQNWLR
jgi:hypothetical protein